MSEEPWGQLKANKINLRVPGQEENLQQPLTKWQTSCLIYTTDLNKRTAMMFWHRETCQTRGMKQVVKNSSWFSWTQQQWDSVQSFTLRNNWIFFNPSIIVLLRLPQSELPDIIKLCVCVCLHQIPRWHINLEPWASESPSLEDEAKRFLSYITTPQVSLQTVLTSKNTP